MLYIIYKISIAGEDYIGSTKDLRQRKNKHKNNCSNTNCLEYNYKLYQFIRANGGWNCIDITPIEEFVCETKQQALCREEHWRREYKATLNTRQAYTTKQELKQNQKIIIAKLNEEKIQCECGIYHLYSNTWNHKRTKKHQEYLSTQEKVEQNDLGSPFYKG